MSAACADYLSLPAGQNLASVFFNADKFLEVIAAEKRMDAHIELSGVRKGSSVTAEGKREPAFAAKRLRRSSWTWTTRCNISDSTMNMLTTSFAPTMFEKLQRRPQRLPRSQVTRRRRLGSYLSLDLDLSL